MFATEGILQIIRAAGYRAFHEGINSDHVMFWADFDLNEFFSGGQAVPSSPQAQEFSFDRLKVREQFLNDLRIICKHRNLALLIYKLELKMKLLGINDNLVRKYNAIDHELIESIRVAANKVVEQKQHGYDRSLALTQAGTVVLFWKYVLTSKLHYIPRTKRRTI